MKKIMLRIFILGLLNSFYVMTASSTILNDQTLNLNNIFNATQVGGLADASFGISGVKNYNINSLVDVGKKVIELPDGSYVLAGTYSAAAGAMLIFVDKMGTVTKTVLTTLIDEVVGLVRSETVIYVVGNASATPKVLAYDFSGNTVTTFGSSGTKTLTGINNAIAGLYHQDALFVIAVDTDYKLYKFDATGTAVSGFTTINLTTSAFTISVAAMAAYNGYIYVAGKAANTEVRKYNAATGAQVTTDFGTTGVATTGQTQVATGISVDQATGEIYVVRISSPVGSPVVHKFKTDGTADTNWASSGSYIASNFGTPTGIIAASGQVQYIIGYTALNVGNVVRIKAGATDSSFGSAGTATNASLTRVYGGLVTSSGNKVLLVGNDSADAFLWRLTGGLTSSISERIKSNYESGNGSGVSGALL